MHEATSSHHHETRIPLREALILAAILLVTMVLYALLMVRDTVPLPGLAILLGLWLLHWIISGRLSLATPMDMPLLALLALLPLSLYISIDRALSLPKVYGLVLGINIFYLIVNLVRSRSLLRLVIPALVLLCLGMTAFGLVSSDWTFAGGSALDPVYNRIPHLIDSVPRSTFSGVNVNTTGGMLTFLVPLLAGLMWDRGSFRRTFLKSKTLGVVYKLVLAGAAGAAMVTLLLTQSRGAILGSAAGLLTLAIWKNRRFVWLLPLLLLIILAAFYIFAEGDPSKFISMLDTNEFQTLPGRLEAWKNTLYLIQDFPITGAGIGTYNKLFAEVYSFIPFALQGEGSYHAHSTYLASAVDLGLPALVLYMALAGSAATMALRTVYRGHTLNRALARGLACGLLAHLVFGIMDAFLLGTKPGAILWVFYGLIAALYLGSRGSATAKRSAAGWWKGMGIGLGLWGLASLAALAFVTTLPWLSILIAGVLGVVLGILSVAGFLHNQLDKQPFENR